MVHQLRCLLSLLGCERWPFNTIDLTAGKDKTDATLIPMDARQQMMWEVCFPRKRIQEKEIRNFDLAQAMRVEGHCLLSVQSISLPLLCLPAALLPLRMDWIRCPSNRS